jgi:hypothetical protein
MKKIHNYLRYSSIKISFQFNPFQWRWIPYFDSGKSNEWPDENAFFINAYWIFLSFRVYLDDGTW